VESREGGPFCEIGARTFSEKRVQLITDERIGSSLLLHDGLDESSDVEARAAIDHRPDPFIDSSASIKAMSRHTTSVHLPQSPDRIFELIP
jgi:hypothetical protein